MTYWRRTGPVVILVAAGVLLVFFLFGPLVYLVRVSILGCKREYKLFRRWYAEARMNPFRAVWIYVKLIAIGLYGIVTRKKVEPGE